MCTLIAEVVMLLYGLYAVISGRIILTRTLQLEGWRARVAGLFLIAPLPLAFIAGLLLGSVYLVMGVDPSSSSAQISAMAVEVLFVVGGFGGAVLFGVLFNPRTDAI